MLKIRLICCVLLVALCVPSVQPGFAWADDTTSQATPQTTPPATTLAATNPPVIADLSELPAIKVAMSDDQSIIVGRILNEALRRSGYQMVSQITGMRTAVADVNFGDAAILPLQTDGWEQRYENLIKVPVAIDNVEMTAYTRSTDTYEFSTWADMDGLKVGFRWQNEYVANNVWRANARELISVNETEDLWASLLSGDTDVVMGDVEGTELAFTPVCRKHYLHPPEVGKQEA